jgi:hypothetical protein
MRSVLGVTLAMLLVTPALASDDVTEVAEELTELYSAGEREAAQELIDEHPQAYSWDQTEGVVEVLCTVGSGGLELTVERSEGVEGALVVTFPPGTFGSPLAPNPDPDGDDDDPDYQELLITRAPVVVLAADQDTQTISVHALCGNRSRPSPSQGMTYHLTRTPVGTSVDQLMVYLCSGDETPSAEAQLAVWITRNRILRGQVAESQPFGAPPVDAAVHAGGASFLLSEAGVGIDDLPFFQGEVYPGECVPLELADH